MNDNALCEPVRQVIEYLVQEKYHELELVTKAIRLDAASIEKVIADYGRQLVRPPDDAYDLLDVVEIRDAQPRQWSVVMPLWTKEEGRSDLSLEMTVIASEKGFTIELDDIHVR